MPIFVELEALMHARDHDVELGHDIGRHVERAVFEDVGFGAVDDPHGRIERGDLGSLRAQSFAVQPARVRAQRPSDR